jgi:UDP-N-acetylglucosamine:LPS N-acetylglucosamine transferase
VSDRKKVLFLTWSVGLGHVTRDLAIVREVRKRVPRAEFSWLACPPASQVLSDAREELLPDAALISNSTTTAEEVTGARYRLNIADYLLRAEGDQNRNLEVFKKVISENEFDLIIGDESYEVVTALINKRISLKCLFVAIHDFWGLDTMTSNPEEKLIISRTNRKYMKRTPRSLVRFLFVGEPEDVPDRRFGFLRPNRRMRARQNCIFLGYIVPFDPTTHFDKAQIRQDLGYGKETLIICSIGGTAVGEELLVLCGESFPLLRNQIPDLRMILACGPRGRTYSLKVQQGLEVRRYVPDLWKHFAACDLAIVQAGGTTTAELTVLGKPFIYFPLEEHFEQQLYITARLERQGAGIRVQYPHTTPESLVKIVLSNLDQEVDYPSIPSDGAKRAADIITCLLEDGS